MITIDLDNGVCLPIELEDFNYLLLAASGGLDIVDSMGKDRPFSRDYSELRRFISNCKKYRPDLVDLDL